MRWRDCLLGALLTAVLLSTAAQIAPGVPADFPRMSTGDFASGDQDATFGNMSTGRGMIEVGGLQLGTSGDGTVGSLDLDGVALFRNTATPDANIEFLFSRSNSTPRFALSIPGAGLATYNSRSFIVAGPATFNNNVVECATWSFTLIDCDTAATGADLGVQDDLEVNGFIFPESETADPCAGGNESGIFYNTTSNYLCYCDGTNDVQVHDPATACF